MVTAPLHGFRALDACDELAVYATRLLYQLGADVVRVEPAGGDPMRRFPPLAEDVSLYWEHFNAGKSTVTLDLQSESGRAELLNLVAACNAVVESAHPSGLLSSTIGTDRLRAARPDLVLVTVTPFGLQGPHRDWNGGDLVVAAESGLLALNGRLDAPPYRPGGEQAAHMAGLIAASATLLGLVRQQRTGHGVHLEVPANMAATHATLQTANANYFTWHGRVPKRRGIGLPWFRLLQPAADGWVAIQALPGQWENLVRLLAAHDAADDLADPCYRQGPFRMEHAEHLNDVLAAFTCRFPKAYIFEEGQKAGIAVVPVNSPADIVNDTYLERRGFFRTVDHPRLGSVRVQGTPFQVTEQEGSTPKQTHTAAVPPAPLRTRTANDRGGILAGVRVLDFTWMIAGPLGTRLLSNFGADVIKVESYNRVDRVRETGPHPDGPWSYNEDGSFNDVNLGKKSILLNLGHPQGQALAKRLAAVSDIVAANFTGNRMDRWGLGFADLASVNPHLIFLNMPVFESAGPRQRWGAIGSHINALAGINALSGYESDPPFGIGPLYPDFSGNPYHANSAVLAALLNRDRGAGAQFIEVSQYESTVSIIGPALLQQAVTGEAPPRDGNHSSRACPHDVYPCAGDDRWIAVAVKSDAEFAALCRVLEREEWSRDARFASCSARRAHEDALDALIATITIGHDAVRLAARLQSAGVAASPVRHLDDLLADPWYRQEYFSDLRGPEGCLFTTHGEVIRTEGRKQPLTVSPSLGEHTDQVLTDVLGMSRAELDALYAEGTLG